MARQQSRRVNRNYPGVFESLGNAVAHNLTLLLAIAFLAGIGYTLEHIGGMIEQAADTPAPAPDTGPVSEPTLARDSTDPGMDPETPVADEGISETTRQRIEHFRRCGFRDYREKHYDSCVPDGSVIWRRPYRDSGAGNTV